MDQILEDSVAVWSRELDNRLGTGDDFHLEDFYVEPVSDSRYGSQVEILSSFTELHDGSVRKQDPEKREIQLATLDLQYGWRLWLNIGCLAFGLFLSSLETTIIATSLVSIASDLGSFNKSNWVVTSYLLTYTGFLIIFARISDLFGRKGTVLVSLTVFTLFSLACGVSQTMEQLIVFRAFQGMGGAGLYSMAVSVITEITPLKYIGISSGLMGSIFAMSSLLGPNLGGAITQHSTWRWVFYLK
ncbi:Putative major facilitator superfamily, MFS transporter superfamily [Colletotrichum destructivum]|uniref:Major facilitator superfamily, MFS transporter superfamily n=1 Tax=Colletotrichum destructivum TaxID=34406 RepID=A0AAX4INH3_9PEZI|nr:Putative major facilitator superfamily, MFS transporter superfamily [Colletotrichum destructivum]